MSPGGSRVTNEVDYLRMRRQAAAEARKKTWRPASLVLLEFVETTSRGLCTDTGRRRVNSDEEGDPDGE